MLKKILINIDSFICNLYDLKKSLIAQSVNMRTQEIIVTTSHKRFPEKTDLNNININELSIFNKKQLALSLGKAIANDIEIHFRNEK